jgi:diaminohydroxyphosphoribosylaminopyrimidine deaminase / 5-amino-6-(5-phosphoribosylamino)uracil reductase
MTNPNHEKWMRLALSLAEKGRFTTSPNPMVGAVIVKNDRLIASGYHERYGGDHAEVVALKKARNRAVGATLYITLEPCSTWGKTPPCVGAILQAGIKQVIVSVLDPNPRHHKKGIQALKKAKISVTSGILKKEAEDQNRAFFKYARTGLPFVTLKMAQSLDGKIATRTGKSRWISSSTSREFVHALRAEQDAILVGKNTLIQDDPQLKPILKSGAPQKGKPWRIALDPNLQISPKARIFKGDQITFLAVSEKKIAQVKDFKKKGLILIPIKDTKGKMDLSDLLKKLGSLGVSKLLVEGGGGLAWSLIQEGHVDLGYWIVAPKIIGGKEAKTSVEGNGVEDPNHAFPLTIKTASRLGADWLFEVNFKGVEG